jgi:uncharacterized membrane protein YgcG
MTGKLPLLFLFLFLLFDPSTGHGENRRLFWNDFTVRAQLTNDGRLHIKEEQTLVFFGPWNGGERIFFIRPGQKFRFRGLYRKDRDGNLIQLHKGNLSRVDQYKWISNHTLRWRSRLPSDPPFSGQPVTYLLEYSLASILVRQDTDKNSFLLNHDFAFSGRPGEIRHFRLELSADDGWKETGNTLVIEKKKIPPGNTVIVKKTFTQTGEETVSVYKQPFISHSTIPSVPPSPLWLRWILNILPVVLTVFMSASFFRHEKKAGRFLPLTPASKINEQWLEKHVFHLLPETVGATWEKLTTGHEVAAVLARLVLEKKLKSRLEQEKIPILGWRIPGAFNLHLELLVPKESFSGYEAKLIDGFFIDGDTTDTKKIRKYYKKKGKVFTPDKKLKEPLDKRVKTLTAAATDPLQYRWLITIALATIGFFLLLFNGFFHREEMALTFVGGQIGLVGVIVSTIIATSGYRNRSDGVIKRAVLLHILPTILCCSILVFSYFDGSSLLLSGLSFFYASGIFTLFSTAKTRDGREGIQLSQDLASARRFFKKELKKASPAIRDEWFPYLLAFGLGPRINTWSKRFGHTVEGMGRSTTGTTGTSSFTGGGGNFGGAGASGSWAAAATSLGAGASSSSSSGSSGSSSSGGGGGGGW